MRNLSEYQYTKMPFGKHKGRFLSEIPQHYLMWLCRTVADKAQLEMFENERLRRKISAKKAP